MKKLGVLFLAFIITSTVAIAQQQRRTYDPVERAKKQTEELTEKLSLSKDQAKKVEAINLKYGKKMGDMMKSMRDSGNFDREAFSKKRKTMGESQKKDMAEVLDEGQMKKYEEYLKAQAERRGQGRGQGQGDQSGGNRR